MYPKRKKMLEIRYNDMGNTHQDYYYLFKLMDHVSYQLMYFFYH